MTARTAERADAVSNLLSSSMYKLLKGSKCLNRLYGVVLQLLEIGHIDFQIWNRPRYLSVDPPVTFCARYRVILFIFDAIDRPAPFEYRNEPASTPKMPH